MNEGTPRTQSLERAIGLLNAVAERPLGSTASALARDTSLPRPTVTRTLRTLEDHGFVSETPDGWTLGYELVRLARRADPYRGLVAVARPVLERLRNRTDESALLAVAGEGVSMEIVLQIDATHHVGVASWVGTQVPLYASSAGKLVLAELTPDELDAWFGSTALVALTAATLADRPALEGELRGVRARGWAELANELEEGLAAISAPIRARDGELLAMVGLSGPTFRLPTRRRRDLVPEIQAAAVAIERALQPANR